MSSETPTPVFGVPVRRATAVKVLLGVYGTIECASIVLSFVLLQAIRRAKAGDPITDNQALLIDGLNFVVGCASMVVYLSTAVLFCTWMHPTIRNAHAVGMTSPSPALGVASFFIPFVNLFLPYQAMRTAHKHLSEAVGEKPRTIILGSWWALWVLGNLVSTVILRLALESTVQGRQPSLEELERTQHVTIVAGVLTLGATALCFSVVSVTTALQRRIASYGVP